MSVLGSVAYVSQGSWIQSGTIRDNILFGKVMDKARYEEAVRVCALDKDIENFNYGDLTEIGQRGLNLSGGQKQRVQLARAVYNDADIYLLDDPFSAVDAHTAAALFNVRKHNLTVIVCLIEKCFSTARFAAGLCDDCTSKEDGDSRDSSSGVSQYRGQNSGNCFVYNECLFVDYVEMIS